MTNHAQQKQPKGPFVLGVLIVIVGVGWLLMVKGFLPSIDWIWTLVPFSVKHFRALRSSF